MIPAVVGEQTRSAAERRVFGLLEQTKIDHISCCLHSLSLSQHDYKLCAEADFVVVTDRALIVLEVKGGGVANRDGLWVFTDRFGNEHRKSEGPFQQARSAMFALLERLKGQFGESAVHSVVFGYGVVFPDCEFPERSVEWDDAVVLDASVLRGLTDISEPLRRLVSHWATKQPPANTPPVGLRDRVLQFLRPSFERVPSLRNRADALDLAMEALTEEQYSRLDIIQANPRILCSGGAGTGKTFLALEVARRHTAGGQRVLFACAGRTLAAFLKSRVASAEITIVAADDKLSALGTFDALVVDEGQDLINVEILDRLDRRLSGGLETGIWRFFYDANSQAGLTGRFDDEALALLQSYGAVSATLTRNCRNTNEIVLQTKLLTGSDIGMPSAGTGPPVHYEFYESREHEARLVDEYWKELTTGDVPAGDVTVLSPLRLEESCLPLTRLFKKNRVRTLDEDAAFNWPNNAVTFSGIVDFKGLENRFVAIVDLETMEDFEHMRKLLYVGMTRARTGLWIGAHERLRSPIAAASRKHMAAVLPDLARNEARPA